MTSVNAHLPPEEGELVMKTLDEMKEDMRHDHEKSADCGEEHEENCKNVSRETSFEPQPGASGYAMSDLEKRH